MTTLNRHKIQFGLWAALCVLSIWGIRELSFIDLAPIIAPVEVKDNTLIIRADNMGEGHFRASRSGGRRHRGVDLAAPLGSPVLAAKGGMVTTSKLSPKGMGEYIVIKHPDGTTTLYGHLQERYVKTGQRIQQGKMIGSIGKTGNARSPAILPHLHFEMKVDGEVIDPTSEAWLFAFYQIERPPRRNAQRAARGYPGSVVNHYAQGGNS